MLSTTMKRVSLPTFEYERLANAEGFSTIGVDEAGRGPLAGPVVAAAAHYRADTFDFPTEEYRYSRLIRDSKTLSECQREEAYRWIIERFDVGVGIVDVEEIDRMNILNATLLAMKKSISNLLEAQAEDGVGIRVLVDGNREIPGIAFLQTTIVKGDARSVSIAAASIVAKVTRDRMMGRCDEEYPEYGFSRHKGYGTAEHLRVIRRFGPCPIHRKSFAPIREFARNEESWYTPE